MLLTLEDLLGQDELLGPNVTAETLEEAHQALYMLAATCNVKEPEVKATHWVKRYIAAYAFSRTAIRKSYSLGGAPFRNGEDGDAFSRKVAFYENELKALEAKVSALMFTGSNESNQQSFRATRLYRG